MQEGTAPDRLTSAVTAFREPGFAIVDGGHFEDLPGLLRQRGLFGRSLFLDQADVEIEKAGPWLVPLDQRQDTTIAVQEFVGGLPAVVFWSCRDGEQVLYRHLRTLNKARIPDWAAAGNNVPPDSHDARSETYTTMLFRHWDPRVLAALLPVLNAEQFARVLGPANEIALSAQEYGGLKRVMSDPAWPSAPHGMLTISAVQVTALADRRVVAAPQRIVAYLRDVAQPQVADQDQAAMIANARRYDREARGFGLQSD